MTALSESGTLATFCVSVHRQYSPNTVMKTINVILGDMINIEDSKMDDSRSYM